MQGFGKDKSEHNYEVVKPTTQSLYQYAVVASIQKEAYLIISILTPIHRSTLEIFFLALGQRHIQIYFSTGTNLKDSNIQGHYASQLITVIDLLKISAFIFKVSPLCIRSQKTLHFSVTAVKTSNVRGTHASTHAPTHTHCTKQYLPATHDAASSRGEPFADSDRHLGTRSSSPLRTCPVTKVIFPTCYSLICFCFSVLDHYFQ
jgi:hypothetical protein